jgi:hypothetical protein
MSARLGTRIVMRAVLPPLHFRLQPALGWAGHELRFARKGQAK